ncbi:hypothetical protein [Halomicronema sp. CCY15110]|uniref:hypothetical protein n=1 Tax=Halomicronema sp. CCY15110 TaxID=2767773 RepID=UPI0019522904|nr:hypothetical protein [Halomicronema sp. CCY15110]
MRACHPAIAVFAPRLVNLAAQTVERVTRPAMGQLPVSPSATVFRPMSCQRLQDFLVRMLRYADKSPGAGAIAARA